MSSIIIPRRALMQPQGRVVACRDFQASFLFNAASPYVDLATGREFTLGPDAQNAPFRPTKQGVGYFPLDTNVGTLYRAGFLSKPEIIPGSVTLIAQVQGALYGNHAYFSMGGAGRGIGVSLNGAYSATGAAVLIPQVTYLGIAGYTLPTTGLKPLDEPVTLVAVTRAGSVRAWANGVFLGSVAAGTPVATLVDDTISVGYVGGASNGYRGGTTCFAVLPVPVEDDTAQSLSRNPWQMFAAEPRRTYFDVPSSDTLNLTGSAASTSAASALISVLASLQGNAQAASIAAAEIATRLQVQGAAIAASLATGQLHVQTTLSGSATTSSVGAGSLSAGIQLVGAALSSSSAAGEVKQTLALSGAAVMSSTATGQLDGGLSLTGSAGASSEATGTLATFISLMGSASASSSATGNLGSEEQKRLDGVAVSMSVATGVVSIGTSLMGSAQAGSQATGSLTVTTPLAGDAESASTATGQLRLSTLLSGEAIAQSLAAAGISLTTLLTGSAESSSTATGTITSQTPGGGTAVASSEATGVLTIALSLTGAAQASAIATGAIQVTQNINLEGEATSSSEATGTISVGAITNLEGGATSESFAAGLIVVQIPLSGSALASAVATGQQLLLNINLAGSATSGSSATGYLGEQPIQSVNDRWLIRRKRRRVIDVKEVSRSVRW